MRGVKHRRWCRFLQLQNVFAICSPNLPADLFFVRYEAKERRLWICGEMSLPGWECEVRTWLRFVFQPGRFKLEGLLISFLEPSNPFHGWPGLARVWAAARSRKNMKSMYLKKKKKKASDAALHVLKKYASASRGTKETYTQAHAHSLSQSRRLWKLSAQRWEYKAVLKHAAGIKRLFH